MSVYRTSKDCDKVIKCAELQKGEICYGELVIEPYLKPCPFCGNKAVKVCSSEEINGEGFSAKSYAVLCSISDGGCGASGGYKDTREEAVANWNQRA